jgi:predicted dienelactone hydrolase
MRSWQVTGAATWLMMNAAAAGVNLDAPELAQPGPAAVGVIEKSVVHRAQLDPTPTVAARRLLFKDRTLRLIVWYPAEPSHRQAQPYPASLSEPPPSPPRSFTLPSTAISNAEADGAGHPVVIVSHGFANDPAMMSWMGENLATKGYVVVAIAHLDPGYTETNRLIEPILWRPLDIAFVAHEIRGGLLGKMADGSRIALIGYSMGGYGVLTAAGALLDPSEPPFKALPSGWLERYRSGGSEADALNAGDVKAVIAIAPGGKTPFSTWGNDGLASLHAPLLVIVGDADRVVGFRPGPADIFAEATHVPRTLLVFKEGGHSIGVDPVPPGMRSSLWDADWFEDPVWRKDRVISVSLHFITAFLDLHLKGDPSRAAYFDVSNPDSDKSPWNAPDAAYDAVSGGMPNTAWKGFLRNHQAGLVLQHLDTTK